MTSARFATIALSAALACASAGALTISSDFSASDEGWTANNAWSIEHRGDDGNPGGFLVVDNVDASAFASIVAPGKFLGDLSAFNGGSIAFDGKTISRNGPDWNPIGGCANYGCLMLQGAGIIRTRDLAPGVPGTDAWSTYSAPLTADYWGIGEADWVRLLSRLSYIQLSIEGVFGAEVQGIDNFRIMSAPIPEPATHALLAVGLSVVFWARRRRRRQCVVALPA